MLEKHGKAVVISNFVLGDLKRKACVNFEFKMEAKKTYKECIKETKNFFKILNNKLHSVETK